MLRNVLDVDFEAQIISLRTRRGAIVLFDFKSAFPSISHDYLWEALLAVGLPEKYVQTLQLFYKHNKHFLKLGGKFYESVEVRSGVRQGCPLSQLWLICCCASCSIAFLIPLCAPLRMTPQ